VSSVGHAPRLTMTTKNIRYLHLRPEHVSRYRRRRRPPRPAASARRARVPLRGAAAVPAGRARSQNRKKELPRAREGVTKVVKQETMSVLRNLTIVDR
jgi:hypothetical protein